MPNKELTIRVSAQDATSGVIHRIEGSLHSLKRTLGRGSTFAEVGELFKLGGALLGVRIALEAISRAGEGMTKLSETLRSGKANLDDVINGFGQAIPVTGQTSNAVRALKDGFVDLVGGIGAANGASDAFIERWTSIPTKLNEAKAAIDHLAEIKGIFQGAWKGDDALLSRIDSATKVGPALADAQRRDKHRADIDALNELKAQLDNPNLKESEREAVQDRIVRREKLIAKTDAAEQQKLEKDTAESRQKVALDAEDKINEIKARSRQTNLQAQGKDLAAELDQIEEAYNRQVLEIVNKAAEERKKDPDQALDIEERMLRATDAARVEYEAKRATVEKTRAERQQGIDEQLAQSRLASADAEAKAGGRLKQIEAEKLHIAEEYRQKRQDIQKIIADEAATEAQRQQAQGRLSSLDQEEAAALARAGREKYEQKEATLTTGRFVGDIASNRAFQNPNAVLEKKADEHTKLQQRIAAGIEALSRYMSTTDRPVSGVFAGY